MLQAKWSSTCGFLQTDNWPLPCAAAVYRIAATVCTSTYLHIPCSLPSVGWQEWMWLPLLPKYCAGWAFTEILWRKVFWRVSVQLWKAPFTSHTNKWNSLFHQSKIDNSSDISYAIFWILKEVWVPLETPTFLLPFPFVSREPAGRLGGWQGMEKEKLWPGKRRKMTEKLFLFLISSATSFSFQSLANEIVPVQPQWMILFLSSPILTQAHQNEVVPQDH